jgi:hypothetical protein
MLEAVVPTGPVHPATPMNAINREQIRFDLVAPSMNVPSGHLRSATSLLPKFGGETSGTRGAEL